ncbi:MAG: hypothetical protein N2512_01380, partial [Armatimonadetes bacterium]|nr:hypothetical protein [Armatimonadota bacterium]
LQAAISSQPDNIAFDFGSVDGYSISDVAVFLVHTGFKLGASPEAPFVDPPTGERVSFEWGEGPWGSLVDCKLDNCVIGFECVLGTILPNQLTNIMVHVSLTDGRQMEVAGGPVARQAALLIEPGFAGATLQVSNLSLSSFAPANVAANAAMVQQAGGRALLIDCPPMAERKDYAERQAANVEIFGLVVSNIPETHMIALTQGSQAAIRIIGYTHNGMARENLRLP